ncbi:MAG: class I adenylate-forming enzyme family protein [Clostridia bacterium]
MLFNSLDEIKNKTLYDVIKSYCILKKDTKAIKFENSSLNGTEFLKRIDFFADYLFSLEIKKDDKIGILLPNCIDSVALIYACNKIGAVATMLNPLEKPKMLLQQINLTNCKAVFFSEISYEKVVFIATNKKNIILRGVGLLKHFNPALIIGGFLKYHVMQNKNILKKYDFNTKFLISKKSENIDIKPCDPALIIFSSGSTDSPKAIVHSSYTINCSAFGCVVTEKENLINVKNGCLALLPVFHIFGFNVAIHISIVAGINLVLVAMFEKEKVAKLFLKEKFEYFPGVPTMYIKLLKSKTFRKAAIKKNYDTSGFIKGFCGGDSLPTHIQEQFNLFVKNGGGKGEIVQGYGLSEICPTSFCKIASEYQSNVGTPFDGTIIRIYNNHENKLILSENNHEGDIYIASTGLFLGYFKNRKIDKTQFFQIDNKTWFKTNDRGFLDDNGNLHFLCRNSQVVKVSGNAINLKLIEDKLLECSLVDRAYIVAVDDEIKGSVVKAVIVPNKNLKNIDYLKNTITNFCKVNLNIWENPKYIIICQNKDIPLTPTLKPDYLLIKNL